MNHLGELAPPPWGCWRWLNHPKLSSPAPQATDMLPKRTHPQNFFLQATRASSPGHNTLPKPERVRNAPGPKTQSLTFSKRSNIQPSNEFKLSPLQDSNIFPKRSTRPCPYLHTCTLAHLQTCTRCTHYGSFSCCCDCSTASSHPSSLPPLSVPSHVFQHVSQVSPCVCLFSPFLCLSPYAMHGFRCFPLCVIMCCAGRC